MDIINQNGMLLTFNNVTKICSNKIFINPSNQISHIQWFPYQLIGMCQLLDIDFKDPINRENNLPNTILGEKIKEKLKKGKQLSVTIHEKDKDLLKDNDLYPIQYGIDFKTSIENPNKRVRLNFFGTKVLRVSGTAHTTNPTTKSTDMISSNIFKPSSDLDDISGSIFDGIDHDKPDTKIDCLAKGKLNNFDSSHCYMDTIFMLLLLDTPENNFSRLFKDKIIDSQKEIKNIYNKINKTKTKFTVEKYLRSIEDEYGDKFKRRGQHDSNEFLLYLFQSFGNLLSFYSENRYINYYLTTNDINTYSGDLNGFSEKYDQLPKIKDGVKNKITEWPFDKQNNIIISNVKYLQFSIDKTKKYNLSDFLCQQEKTLFTKDNIFLDTVPGWKKTKGTNKDQFILSNKDNTEVYALELLDKGYKVINRSLTSHIKDKKGNVVATNYICDVTRSIIDKANYLILSLVRYTRRNPVGDGVVLDTTQITPNPELNLNDKILKLVAIETFTGEDNLGHLFGFYLCDGKWYKYDDSVENKITKSADSWEEFMSQEGELINKRGVMFFYS